MYERRVYVLIWKGKIKLLIYKQNNEEAKST